MATTINKSANVIYLLGTSDLGPVNTPINVTSLNHAKSVFGEKGTLLDAFKIVRENDTDCEIFLVKITGTHSELYLNINNPSGEIEYNGICFRAKYANEIYDDIEVVINDTSLYINYPTQELGDYYIEYKYNKVDENGDDILDENGNKIYKTVYDLAEEINEDTRILNSSVYCYTNCAPSVLANTAFTLVNESRNKLSGGNSGLYYNKNMLYICLEETYNILEGREIDIIVPLGCYYDDTFTDDEEALEEYYDLDREYLTLKDINEEYVNYYQQLLEYCRKQLRFGCVTQGVMGMNLTNDVFIDEDKYYLYLKYFKDKNDEIQINNKYKHLVSVCASDIYTTYGTRVYNSYILYACLIASVQIDTSTTNKPLAKSFTMFNDFSTRTLAKIRDLGYTCFRYSLLKRACVCANGITTSDDENLKFLCNVRMCQLVMKKVNKLLSQYIGENILEIVNTRNFYKRLVNLLSSLMEVNILKGYSINSITIPEEGHLMIDLSFKTLYMTESIRTYSGLSVYRGSDINE